jgi:hypothetical protein
MISSSLGTLGLFAGEPEARESDAIFGALATSASRVTPRHSPRRGISRSRFNASIQSTNRSQAFESESVPTEVFPKSICGRRKKGIPIRLHSPCGPGGQNLQASFWRSFFEPAVQVGLHKFVVRQMRVVPAHPANVFHLAGRRAFVGIEYGNGFEKAWAAEGILML